MIRLNLRGSDEARRILAAGAEQLDDQGIAQGVAEVIKGRARVVAPKKTGRLARSIDLRRAPDSITVGTTVPYAAQVAYGGKHNPRPVPFMEIAVADSGARMTQQAEATVTLQLERAGVL